MANGALPHEDRSGAEFQLAGTWLARLGLADGRPTSLVTTRLAARRRARLANGMLLAWLVAAVAPTQAYERLTAPQLGGSGTNTRRASLIVLAAVPVATVLGRRLLDRWMRGVDVVTMARQAVSA